MRSPSSLQSDQRAFGWWDVMCCSGGLSRACFWHWRPPWCHPVRCARPAGGKPAWLKQFVSVLPSCPATQTLAVFELVLPSEEMFGKLCPEPWSEDAARVFYCWAEIVISVSVGAGEMQAEGKHRLSTTTSLKIQTNEVNWFFLQRFCFREKIAVTSRRSWIFHRIPVFREMEDTVMMTLLVFKMKLSVVISRDNNPLLV